MMEVRLGVVFGEGDDWVRSWGPLGSWTYATPGLGGAYGLYLQKFIKLDT